MILRALDEAVKALGIDKAPVVTLNHEEHLQAATGHIHILPAWLWALSGAKRCARSLFSNLPGAKTYIPRPPPAKKVSELINVPINIRIFPCIPIYPVKIILDLYFYRIKTFL